MRFDLEIPVETRMMMLRKLGSWQHSEIQYVCEHKSFIDGVCEDCDYKCEHDRDKDHGFCLDCKEYVEPQCPDYWEDR